MDKQAMNVDEIARKALWYSETYNGTEFMAFGPGGSARVHVTGKGLEEVASVKAWTWKNRWPGEKVGDHQWEASAKRNGATFYALFSESEMQAAQ